MARDLRQRALEKIAALSAGSLGTSFDKSDLGRLCRSSHGSAKGKELANGSLLRQGSSIAKVPMSIREFEVLLALCKAAPLVRSAQSAQKLAHQLAPYMVEAHVQAFVPSPFFRRIEPSPTESLSFHVAAALLSLGVHYDDVHELVSGKLWAFLSQCSHATRRISPVDPDDSDGASPNVDEAVRLATLAVALVGFLDAASAQTEFWRSGGRLSLVQRVREEVLSEKFLVAVETAFSTIRNAASTDRHVREWKRLLRHYSALGRPLGAMLLQRSFAWLAVSATSLLAVDVNVLRGRHVLDLLMSGDGLLRPMSARSGDADFASVETYATYAVELVNYLDASKDFIRLGSAWQQRLALAVRSSALMAYLNCSMVNEDAADADVLMAWLEDCLADRLQMADEAFASVVLRCMAIICRISPAFAAGVSRLLPRFIVQGASQRQTVEVAATCLANVLQLLSTDAVITTLYTLGNVLSPGSERALANGGLGGAGGGVLGNGADTAMDGGGLYGGRQSTGSSISLQIGGEEDSSVAYGNVVQAICAMAAACKDDKITALAQSMLLQKIAKVNAAVDARIISSASSLALSGGQLEFRSLLKMYARMSHVAVVESKDVVLQAVLKARNHISANLHRGSPLYDVYWEHMLEGVISKGDVSRSNQTKDADVELAAREIAQLLQPLAVFMSTNDMAVDMGKDDDDTRAMLRDAWFNIVVHGFTTNTDRGRRYVNELRIMAVHSPPLVSDSRGEQDESDIELNTVLRRASGSDREAAQKKYLAQLIPSKASEIRGLSYRKVIFLQAAYLVESLRADSGDCTKALSYFLEPSMRTGDVASIMESVTSAVVDRYLRKTLSGNSPSFSAQYAATQLATIFCGCCHRIARVQQAAFSCADRIIREVPSALCHTSSLFALLELLSLMWSGCLESETDEYEPRSCFRSERGNVSVELSDDYEFRRHTLNVLQKRARVWLSTAINLAPSDVKGLLQTYLSEFDDEGAYGHLSLGRSFAVEMGASIPSTDQRLSSLDQLGGYTVNTASDFMAQYTTRQEYRYAEALPDHSMEWLSFMQMGRRNSFVQTVESDTATDAVTALAHVESRLLNRRLIPLPQVRDILRRAAAILCRSHRDECAIIHYLVTIPFAMFTKQSIKLGVSLWLGVMNENPRMEPRILNEIAQQWEFSVQKRLGLFSTAFQHPDPFFVKEEFAPSDLDGLQRQKQTVHNLLAPHTRLLYFFNSHFNATRLGSPDTQRVFIRLLDPTLAALKTSTPHPMAREIRLHIVLLALRVLRSSSTLGPIGQYRLKDAILSGALAWFANAPRWSFGSNNLQLKTEMRLLSDVVLALKAVNVVGAQNLGQTIRSLQAKEQLLVLLLESEHARLTVWVHTLGEPAAAARAGQLASHNTGRAMLEAAVVPLCRVAWNENPSIAVELVSRFSSPQIFKEVRWLLLNFPAKAISDPEAIPILLNGSLPDDVSFQLKYLLFWAPVNPITAITYFLPSYRYNPFLLQYAMRSLESHSVDVTFFYVPQIVQALRYDTLGYAERYILETAQFSQLFAHQIIWNMKANSYKDNDAEVPDDIKPTLDKVMTKMIEAFTPVDRGFYEREFSFFNEVTDISGKLKPYIKKSKPEKKQKIEEELRKIKVEVGVYLPCNPEGVVIGIDRKSGKPLQSHAKAPYMATFRIKKTKGGVAQTDDLLEETNAAKKVVSATPQDNTVEVWKSAIFKVGDDVRQDVLALQMISAFRGIFQDVGLDVYVFPNRVTATAPGRGVIDVLPNSISRDMLGREAVNGLYEYFTSKYGNEDSLRFQAARKNFVKSMAAYSVISFLLQFKDRHNGNIMIDDAGHILHIDFGFCFDIAPGGIKFERAPFKLTSEMVAVMGGTTDHQAFKWFEELSVKAFLASRQHAEKLAQIVLLMMDSGLPCFKPETVKHFRDRFVLERSERDAADFMKDLIKKSYTSVTTGWYDGYQLMTNGIPY